MPTLSLRLPEDLGYIIRRTAGVPEDIDVEVQRASDLARAEREPEPERFKTPRTVWERVLDEAELFA